MTILSSYNTTRFSNEIFDSKLVYFLALGIFGKESIVNDLIELHRLNFARSVFEHRLKNELNGAERLGKFETHMITTIKELKARNRRLQENRNEFNRYLASM